jgi:hypothetical protein
VTFECRGLASKQSNDCLARHSESILRVFSDRPRDNLNWRTRCVPRRPDCHNHRRHNGIILGILVGFGSSWAARQWSGLPRRWLDFPAFVAMTLFGGSLLAMLLYVASPTPENVLTLMRPPFKGGFSFFVTFNSLMEWLVIPVAVFLNWRHPRRRRLLVAVAVLFYLSRVWTYIYFVPQIFRFMTLQASTPLSSEGARDVLKWVKLIWIRCTIDGIVAVLFLRATSLRENSGPSEICNAVS